MASTIHEVATGSGTDGDTFVSDAFIPAVNDLLVVWVSAAGTVQPTAAGAVTDSEGGTYDLAKFGLRSGGASSFFCFIRTALISSAVSMTVTFTCTGDPSTGAEISVEAVSGMSRTGLGAVRQSEVQTGGGAGTTPTVTLPAACLTGNSVLGGVGAAGNPPAVTEPAGWTELVDAGHSAPANGIEAAVIDGGFTSATVTWGSTSASAFCAIVVELDTSSQAVFDQPHFRIRAGDAVGLNTDSDWVAALDTNATIDAEKIFRIRFEVESAGAAPATSFKLQYRRNGGTWTDVPVNTAAPPVDSAAVEIVLSAQFANDDATTNLLSGSSRTFEAGVGLEDNLTPSITLNNEHTEYEWALRMRVSWGSGAGAHGRNADGDTFEFRLADPSPFTGTVLNPVVTLNIPNYLIGGTTVETPHRIGPFKNANGDLYYILEYAETSAFMQAVKSTDGGVSWARVDSANEPQERDLECVDVQMVGDTLHILHHGVEVFYHTLRMSDHGTNPDTWGIKDELVHTVSGAPPQDQSCGISVRSDGTIVAVYNTTPSGAAERQGYRIRSVGGVWGAETILDAEGGAADFTDVAAVRGASDKTHIFYVDLSGGLVWHRSLSSADVLSAREQVSSGLATGTSREHPLLAAVYYDDAGAETIVVGYTKSTDFLWTNSVVNDGTPGTEQQVTSVAVACNIGGSDHPAAFLANDGTTVYAFYGDAATQDLWRDENLDLAGWGTDVEFLDATTIDLVVGEVFTHSVGNGGSKVVGMVYDEASLGGVGKLKYTEYVIAAGAVPNPASGYLLMLSQR